jgi:hypothetical protein
MDSSRWERIQAVFHEAAALPQAEQHAFLRSACSDDISLMTDVLAMLEEDGRETSVLDCGMAQLANHLLDENASSLAAREFGPYRVLRVLGEGGMGVVYLAERRDLGSLVALNDLPASNVLWLSSIIPLSLGSTMRMHSPMALHGL